MEPEPDVVYAGFLRRWAAIFLDQLILTTGYYVVLFVVILAAGAASGFRMTGDEPPSWLVMAYTGATALYFVIAGAYYSLFESSASQATLGKMALGIKVTDQDGNRLSVQHALGRWFAAALSYLTLYIGFFAAAFTARKQALHDVIARTLVVDKWAFTENPERQQRSLHGCLIAFLVVMVLMVGIAVLGILAAIAIPAYQDYTVRAHVSNAYHASEPVRRAIDESRNCAGIAPPESYRSPSVDRIEVLEERDGCSILIRLAPRPGLFPEASLRLRQDPSRPGWTCESDLPERQFPAACR